MPNLQYGLFVWLMTLTLACTQSPQGYLERLATAIPETTPTAKPEPVWEAAVQVIQAEAVQAALLPDGTVAILDGHRQPQIFSTVATEYDFEFWSRFPYDLHLQDLDGDNQPELILVVSTPGASCCTTLAVIYFDREQNQYAITDTLYRKYTLGFDITDLDGDGVVEFRTLNEDFNYALGGASVVSFYSPLQIWRYDAGQLRDVTVEFPALVQDHAAHWLEDEELLCSIFGAGAYVAEMAMLDQIEVGWDIVRKRCTLPAEEISLVEQALHQFGYQKSSTKDE